MIPPKKMINFMRHKSKAKTTRLKTKHQHHSRPPPFKPISHTQISLSQNPTPTTLRQTELYNQYKEENKTFTEDDPNHQFLQKSMILPFPSLQEIEEENQFEMRGTIQEISNSV